MKKILFLIIALYLSNFAFAQWQGTNPVYFNSGNVGIGTSSPWAPLSINSVSSALAEEGIALAFEGGGFTKIGYRFKANGSNYYQVIYNGSNIQWKNWNGSMYIPKMSLTNSGYLGIGTTSPNGLLDIKKPSSSSAEILRFTDGIYKLGSIQSLSSTDGYGLYIQGRTEGGSTPVPALTFAGYANDVSPDHDYDAAVSIRAYDVTDGSKLTNMPVFRVINSHTDVHLSVEANGNVGIGTTSPQDKLDVAGTIRAKNQYLKDVGPMTTVYATNGQSGYRLNVINQTGDVYRLQKDGATQFILKSSGNVGIGTTTPGNKLEVNGTIRSKKVKVDANGWPDYVFAPSYELRALSEVESFIKANHHLPEVPSAKVVAANGLDLGSMDATLLKKVEELTLYLIQESKEKDGLKKENKELKETLQNVLERLERLEKR